MSLISCVRARNKPGNFDGCEFSGVRRTRRGSFLVGVAGHGGVDGAALHLLEVEGDLWGVL